MNEVLAAIMGFCMGPVMFLNRRKIAQRIADSTNKHYPFKYGEAQVTMYSGVIVVVAFSFVVFGVIALLRLFKWL